jgi:ribonuclease HII
VIERDAIEFAVTPVDEKKIDEINILNASILAMHLSLDQLKQKFEFIIVDGNRFKPYKKIPHQTIVKGDGKYLSIAAASILAKTYRDEMIEKAHEKYPEYDWLHNKGYATAKHRAAILEHGLCALHRKTFQLKEMQLGLF